MKNKKGISALVAAVLLIVITIVAIGIIWGAILPMVQKGLGTTQACGIETRLTIPKERGYTCWDASNNLTFIEVERPMTEFELAKLILKISGGGKTKTYEVVNGSSPGPVYMYGNPTASLELPKRGESRTYNVSVDDFDLVEQVGVAAVVRVGKRLVTCEPIMVDIGSC